MAEFQDVILQINRMCEMYKGKCSDLCELASFHRIHKDAPNCRGELFVHPREIEQIVIKWAEEHSQPVFPTWGEWLQDIGVAQVGSGMLSIHPAIAEQPIPSSFAQEHRIEPKGARS